MIIRRVARPLLAAIFITGGLNALRKPEGHAQAVSSLIDRAGFGPSREQLPADLGTLVQVDGAVKVGAGALLALGKLPRLAALLLAASLVPTTVAGHPFWEYEDEGQRRGQLIHFEKNLGLLGGLLMVLVDNGGGKRTRDAKRERTSKRERKQAKRAAKAERKAAAAA